MDILANGEDPDLLAEATGDTENVYEWDESSDEEDGSRRKKKGTKPRISRRHREFPTLDSFLASAEGLDRTNFTLFEHVAETLEALTSDFYHNTLPAQLTPKTLFVPENLASVPLEQLTTDPNTELVFSPEGFQTEAATRLFIVRYPEPRASGRERFIENSRGEIPLFALRRRWKVVGPVVLDGFNEDWLRGFRGWICKKAKKEK